jgi:hypothetical protein
MLRINEQKTKYIQGFSFKIWQNQIFGLSLQSEMTLQRHSLYERTKTTKKT